MAGMTDVLAPMTLGAVRALPAAAAAVWLLDPQGERLQLAGSVGELQVPSSGTGDIASNGSPLVVRVLSTGAASVDEASGDDDPAIPSGARALVAVRLGTHETPLGILLAYDTSPRRWKSAEIETLAALGALGSAAMAATRRLSDLEQGEAARSQVMRVTTHELRSPVAVSQTLIRNVVKGYAGPLTEKQAQVFRRISWQLDSLEALINDLLDLAATRAPESGSPEEPVAVNASLGRAVLLLQPRAEEKGVALHFRSSREELVIRATEEGLDRIFVNLIGNAVKYTPSGGQVTVSLGRAASPDEVQVVVADTGIGMAPEALSHLFEEFYRAPNARAAGITGTGLGLAIVKELVNRYRGRITVESEIDRGTTFVVCFPACGPP